VHTDAVSLLRRRDFRLLTGAVGVSALGDWLALTPLALHLEERTGSGLLVALLFVAVWSPAIVLAPLAGALVDRLETRRLLAAVSVAQAGVAVVLAFSGETWLVLALAGLLGTGFALAQPAEFALVPAVAGERVREANGYIETSRYVGFTLGPLVGGILAATGGMQAAMLVNAVTFLAVAAAALVIRADRRVVAADEVSNRARDGVVFLFRDRLLRLVIAVAFVSLLFMTASAPAEVFFAVDVLEVGEVGFGALLTSWTLGMALGALVLARRFAMALAGGALVAIVVQSLGLALPTLWLVFTFALVAYAIGGLAHGLKNVLVRSLIHERVPEHLHGRAYAAYNGIRNFAELFAIMGGGLLVVAIGARWTLLLAGALPALAGVIGLVLYRRLPREEPLEVVVEPEPAVSAGPA
jgi:MFS family permease